MSNNRTTISTTINRIWAARVRIAALVLIALIINGVPAATVLAFDEAANAAVDRATKFLRGVPRPKEGGRVLPTFETKGGAEPLAQAGPIDHFRLCPRTLQMYVGEDFNLSPAALDKNGKPVQGVVIGWSSSNAAVAPVDGSGLVTALSPGQSFVTAQQGSALAKVAVQVLAGLRPVVTDKEWDAEHAHDCDDPTDNSAPQPRQTGLLPNRPGNEISSLSATLPSLQPFSQPEAESKDVRAVPATLKESPRIRQHAIQTSARAPRSLRGVAFQGGPILLEGGSPDGFTALVATAPGNATGSPRLIAQEEPQGSVQKLKNIFASADFVFSAPILSLPGRGVGVDLSLVFNSQFWSQDPISNSIFFNLNNPWPLPGWSLGYGRLIGNFDSSKTGDGSGSLGNYPGNYLLIQPDGTRIVIMGVPSGNSYQYQSTDGSHISLNFHNSHVRYPDGTLVNFDQVNNKLQVTSIESRNGDKVTIQYRPRDPVAFPSHFAIQTISDSLGRSINFTYYGDPGIPADTTSHPLGSLASIAATDQDGVSARTLVQMDYTAVTLNYNFQSGLVDASVPPIGTQIWAMNSISYPATGRGYLFSNYSSYGMPRHISVRNQMNGSPPGNEVAYTNYNYPTSTDGLLNHPPQYTLREEFWAGKTDGTGAPDSTASQYTYSSSGFNVDPAVFTVTSPDGTQAVTTSDNDLLDNIYGRTLSTTVNSASAAILSSTTYSYTADGTNIASASTSLDGGPPSVTNYTYDSSGRLGTVIENGFTGSAQRTTAYTYLNDPNYTSANLVFLVTGITVTDNTTGQIATQVDLAYDGSGLLSYGQSPPNRDTAFDNTANLVRGNVTSTTQHADSSGATIVQSMQYDVFGNVVSATMDCCLTKRYTFSPGMAGLWFSLPTSESDGNGPTLVAQTVYNYNTSEVQQTFDPENQVTQYGYDRAWRLASINPPTGGMTTLAFDIDNSANHNDQLSFSRKISYTDSDGSQKLITTQSFLDGAGHSIRLGTGPGAQSVYDAAAMTYDSMGRLIRQYNPYPGDVSALGQLGNFVQNQYDGISRIIKTTLQDQSTVTSVYGPASLTVTDPVGRQQLTQFDGLGRATSVASQDPSVGGPPTVATAYSYDMLDNLIRVDQGGQRRTFTYDQASRLMAATTPEAGGVTFAFYPNSNLVNTRQDARGAVTTYTYNGLNQISSVSYNTSSAPGVVPTPSVQLSYNSASPGIGQISSIIDGAGSEVYAYDSFGRRTSKTRTIDSVNSYTTQYGYNQADQIATLTYPSGKRLRLDHDGRSRLSGEEAIDGSGTILASYLNAGSLTYSVAGQLQSATLGNGIVEGYAYSVDRLQLTNQTARSAANTLMSLAYSYQANWGEAGSGTNPGNANQIMHIALGSTINSQPRDADFTYDNVGRLLTAKGWSAWQRRFSYDRWGNRLGVFNATTGGSQIQSASLSSPGGFPATNQYTSVTNNGVALSQLYDPSGNLLNDGAHTYQYDAENRLVVVDSGTGNEADYFYDANNWRVKRITGNHSTTTYCLWDGNHIIAEYSTAPAGGTGGRKFYDADQASIRLITDANGNWLGTEDVYPFGEDVAGSSMGVSEKHHFTSYERDAETTTDQAINRQYHSGNGRFLQVDPMRGRVSNPQSWNRYAYALDNPIDLVDPLGLDEGCTRIHLYDPDTGEPIDGPIPEEVECTPFPGPFFELNFMQWVLQGYADIGIMTGRFYLGAPNKKKLYGPRSFLTASMRTAPDVARIRQQYCSQINSGGRPDFARNTQFGLLGYNSTGLLNGVLGAEDGVVRAWIEGNDTRQFVGSFRLEVIGQGVKGGGALFKMTNDTSSSSLFVHSLPNVNTGSMLSTQSQTYFWFEEHPCP